MADPSGSAPILALDLSDDEVVRVLIAGSEPARLGELKAILDTFRVWTEARRPIPRVVEMDPFRGAPQAFVLRVAVRAQDRASRWRFYDPRIEEHVLPLWLDHFASHDPAVWRVEPLVAEAIRRREHLPVVLLIAGDIGATGLAPELRALVADPGSGGRPRGPRRASRPRGGAGVARTMKGPRRRRAGTRPA